jgi:hypothetical protein
MPTWIWMGKLMQIFGTVFCQNYLFVYWKYSKGWLWILFCVAGVIMCNKCRKAYGRGGWDRDKEGNDEFCR